MKKWIETITALVMAGFLMVAMVGCGNQVPDQGVVKDAGANADEEIKKQMEEADKAKEGQKSGKGGDKGGGAAPGGGGAAPGGGGAAPGGGAADPGGADPKTPNP